MISDTELAAIKARYEYNYPRWEGEFIRSTSETSVPPHCQSPWEKTLAHARTDIPRLIAEVERLRDIAITSVVNETHVKQLARPIVEAWKEYQQGILKGSQVVLDNQICLVPIEARRFRALAAELENEAP